MIYILHPDYVFMLFHYSHGVEEPLEVLVGLVLVHQDVQLVHQLALHLQRR